MSIMFCMAVNSVPGLLLPVWIPGEDWTRELIDSPRHPTLTKIIVYIELRDQGQNNKTDIWSKRENIFQSFSLLYTLYFTRSPSSQEPRWMLIRHVRLRSRVGHAVIIIGHKASRHSRVLLILTVTSFHSFTDVPLQFVSSFSFAARAYTSSWGNFSNRLISRDTHLSAYGWRVGNFGLTNLD